TTRATRARGHRRHSSRSTHLGQGGRRLKATIPLPVVSLARHGDTAWTVSGQHTGVSDIPLTAGGEAQAAHLGERLRGLSVALVLASPLHRAIRTCELAGFGSAAQIEPDLTEWNYGAYEGRRSVEIHAERPGWDLFRAGCPGGESAVDVGARADRVVRRIRATNGDVLVFSSGHSLRVFAARWLGLAPAAGRYFLLSTASLSAVGYEHDASEPAIRLWDETSHLRRSTPASPPPPQQNLRTLEVTK